MNAKSRRPFSFPVYSIVNQLRRERQLPKVSIPNQPTKITRELLRQLAIEAWKKYPQALIDPDYELGELTLALVEQEIRIRLHDLRRGVVPQQVSLNQYLG